MVPVPWKSLLGQSLEDLETNKVLKPFIDLTHPHVKSYPDGCTYYCFYPQGIALCFTGKIRTLDSIDFYKTDTRYSRVDEALLPESIMHSTTGRHFVQLFGEPKDKGGSCQVNLWLRWRGLQVDLDSSNWEAAKKGSWKSMTLFRT